MQKIFSPGGAGSFEDTGISSGVAATYLLLDGSRAASGNINSATESTYSIGMWDRAFASGVFQTVTLSGFYMRKDNNDLLLSHTDGRTCIARARDWFTSTSGIAITGARLQGTANAQLSWRAGSNIDAAYDTNLCRTISGCMSVGTTTKNASGTLEAASGVFRTQLVFAAPNGSGWKVTVDNNGNLATTGPIALE